MADKQWSRDKSVTSLMAEAYNTALGQMVPRVAQYLRPVYGNSPVSKDEQRRRFWQEAKGWTPERDLELQAQGMSPEDVGLLKYHLRELDAKADGRADDLKAQALWVKEMAELGPPEPDGLEALVPAHEPSPMAPPEGMP